MDIGSPHFGNESMEGIRNRRWHEPEGKGGKRSGRGYSWKEHDYEKIWKSVIQCYLRYNT